MARGILKEMTAEFIGTWILVFFGTGVVHAATLTGAQGGLWQVAVVWALAITLAIYAVGAISGAHLNPAVSIAFATFGNLPWKKVVPYILAQLGGAILAACMLFFLFNGALAHFEKQNNLVRGEAGSELSACCFGEYFPNPGIQKAKAWEDSVAPMPTAMAGEAIGTAFLMFMIYALVDSRRKDAAFTSAFAPIFIGLTVAVCISIIAPLTQAGFNPARDFGPRLVAYFAGWGEIAIPGPRGGFFTVYILSPIVGAIFGGCVYRFFVADAKDNA